MRRADVVAGLAAIGLGYYLTVTGKMTLDAGWGRRVRPLGPIAVEMAAARQVVFDVISTPYLGKTPHAMAAKLRVLERGNDIALAEHYTPVLGGRLSTTTLELVTFERPDRIGFRLLRGPVPHVLEEFRLTARDAITVVEYTGELGTDLWAAGQWWADRVAASWEAAVRHSLAGIKEEAERRSALS